MKFLFLVFLVAFFLCVCLLTCPGGSGKKLMIPTKSVSVKQLTTPPAKQVNLLHLSGAESPNNLEDALPPIEFIDLTKLTKEPGTFNPTFHVLLNFHFHESRTVRLLTFCDFEKVLWDGCLLFHFFHFCV